MATKGVKINTIGKAAVADDIVILRDGSCVSQAFADLATQLGGSGALATRLSRAEIMSGYGAIYVKDRAGLSEVVNPVDKQGAWVLTTTADGQKGIWAYSAAISDWVWIEHLPISMALMTDIGGTANAITATTLSSPEPSDIRALLLLPLYYNTGPVTISLDGNDPVPLLSAGGAALARDALAPGVPSLIISDGTNLRLTFPADVVATVGTLRDEAVAAAAAAQSYVNAQATYDTVANGQALYILGTIKKVTTNGYSKVGVGKADWIRVASEPAHIGKWRSMDRYLPDGTVDSANGGWWAISGIEVTPFQIGAEGLGEADDTVYIQGVMRIGLPINFVGAKYRLTDTVYLPAGTRIEGKDAIIIADGFGINKDVFAVEDPTEEFTTTSAVDITFMVANDHARCGIVTPKISTHAYKHHFIWHNLRFKGSVTVPGDTVWKQDYGFGKHISQGDCYSADIRDIRISGTFGLYTDPVLSPEHCGIYLDGISSLRNVRMDNILMSNVKYPFGIGDNVTSVFLSNADLAASWVGIKTYTTANGGEFIAQNCTFNVQRLGIELRNRSWAILDDVFCTRHEDSFDHAEDWQGFNLKNVNHLFASNARSLHGAMHGNENWVNVGTRVAWDLDDVLYAKFANILNSSAGNLMEIGWRMVNGCADLTFSNVVFDDVATWWDFGPGTTDIEIGNHTHRGAVTTKYKFDASITDEQKLRNFFIHKHNANFAAGVLLVDPYNRRVGVGTQTPAKDLHVYNPSTIAEARIQSGASSASSARLSLLHHGSSASQQWDVKGETDGSFRVRDVTGGHDRLAIGSDGLMQFGTHAAITGETLSGYILIRDEAGNLRKVAVVS